MPRKAASTNRKLTARTRKKKTVPVAKAPTVDSIREKAYFLWTDKGCPQNTEIDNWLDAERQIMN